MPALTPLTKQEVFNKVYLGVLAQGCPSVKKYERYTCSDDIEYGYVCQYLSPAKTKCGIGQLIPENEYEAVMETRGSYENNPFVKKVVKNLMGQNHNEYFLCILQGAHDLPVNKHSAFYNELIPNEKFIQEFKEGMSEIAKEHNLEIPPK